MANRLKQSFDKWLIINDQLGNYYPMIMITCPDYLQLLPFNKFMFFCKTAKLIVTCTYMKTICRRN